MNGSRHAIEVKEETQVNNRGLIKDASLLYIPALVFIISLALALNIHYLHTTTDITFPSFLSSILQDTLNTFDIFLKPTSIGSLRYSIEIIPIMVFIVAVAGVVPSIVLPYFRKFKVTSVNAAPFHKDILFSIVGAVLGLTVVLSLVDIIYGALTGNQPHYYNYVLPTMVGFSLHYSLGAYVGREKAEEMVEKILKTGSGKRVFQGKISIQEQSLNQKQDKYLRAKQCYSKNPEQDEERARISSSSDLSCLEPRSTLTASAKSHSESGSHDHKPVYGVKRYASASGSGREHRWRRSAVQTRKRPLRRATCLKRSSLT